MQSEEMVAIEEIKQGWETAKQIFADSIDNIREGVTILCDIGEQLELQQLAAPGNFNEWTATIGMNPDEAKACIAYAKKRKEGHPEKLICRQVMLDLEVLPNLPQGQQQAQTQVWIGDQCSRQYDNFIKYLNRYVENNPVDTWSDEEKTIWTKRIDSLLEIRNQIQ